jgi:hypothetical protein
MINSGEPLSSRVARIYCIDPEIPNLPDDQLQALHRFKVQVSRAFDEVQGRVDPKIVLALSLLHFAKINADLQVGYRQPNQPAVAGDGARKPAPQQAAPVQQVPPAPPAR